MTTTQLTYKRIEIKSRPSHSNIIEGQITISLGDTMLMHSDVSDSEAALLVSLNKWVQEITKQVNSFEQ